MLTMSKNIANGQSPVPFAFFSCAAIYNIQNISPMNTAYLQHLKRVGEISNWAISITRKAAQLPRARTF